MLEGKDIEKIIDANRQVFATKEELIKIFPVREEVALKEDFETLRKDFSDLQSSIDVYAKKADDYFQEMVMLAHKVDRHEKWIQQIADKLNVKLEY